MNNPSINPTPSQRELWAAHKARQARLWNTKPANTNIKTKPVVEVRPVKARKLPMWEAGDVYFDAHVIRYREWVRAMDEIRAIRTEASFGIGNGDFIPLEPKKTVKAIVDEVLQEYPGISYDDIIGPRCTRHLIEPRHRAMAEVVNQRPDMSFPHIGRIFNRDHTVIIYARNKMAGKVTKK